MKILHCSMWSRVVMLSMAFPATHAHAQQAPDPDALTQVGQMAPDFSMRLADGRIVTLGSMRGRVVVLNLFATWCGYCRQEIPYLEQLQRRHRGADFALVAIGRDQSAAELGAFARANRLSFPVVSDLGSAIFNRYARKAVPRTYVIGPSGRILYQTRGFSPANPVIAQMDALITDIKRSPDGKAAFSWRRRNARALAKLTTPARSQRAAKRGKGVILIDEYGSRRLP